MNFSRALVEWIQRRRWLCLFGVFLLTVVAGMGASRVGVDNSVEIWFLDGDPALESWNAFQDVFGNDEVVVLALHRDDGVLTQEGMERLADVGARALSVEGIEDVVSLATVETISSGEDWLEVAPVWSGTVDSDFKAEVLADPLLVRRLVSEDGKTAVVLAQMEAMDDIDARRDGVLRALNEAVDGGGDTIWKAGIGVIYSALNKASMVDSQLLIAASYGVILLGLFFAFHRVLPVVITIATVGVAATWLMGVYGAFGRNINMVTLILPTLMLVIGVSDCVHFLTHAAQRTTREGESRLDRVRNALAFMFWPCLLNTLTTAAGFLALSVAPMAVVRDLGLFAALGVVGAFVSSVIGCSVGLLWEQAEPVTGGRLQKIADRLAAIATRKSGHVLVVALVCTLFGALGVTRLEVDTYSIDYLRESHEVRQDSDAIESQFGPYTAIEFLVEGDDLLYDVEVLTAVARWQDAMVASGAAGWCQSVVDRIRRLNQVLGDGSPESFSVPENRDKLEQALLLYESDADADLSRLVSADGRQLRVTAAIDMGSAQEIGAAIDRLTDLAQLPEHVTMRASGYLPLYVQMMDFIVTSQVRSFSLALVLIFGLLGVLFRSLRLALLALPANLGPLLCILGIMGAAGIRLDVATVTISAVVLGLIVDDTTQFMYRFRYEMKRSGGDHVLAVERTVSKIGRPILVTSLVLAGGFSILAVATVKSVAWFGVLVGLAVIMALLADLLVLPALIVRFRPYVDVS
jgi:predicted RND superfamily exporter protein